jgi:predicted CoA-binding protein
MDEVRLPKTLEEEETMRAGRVSLETIEDFLAQKRIAMVGISREPRHFSVTLFRELCRRGYDVIPVNPNATEMQGRRCFARVQAIQPAVAGALLMTCPEVTNAVVKDCADAGVSRIWMYRAGGKGAVSPQAVQFCQEHGIAVVPGQCPFMFWEDAGTGHRLHSFIRKITGGYPRRTHSSG